MVMVCGGIMNFKFFLAQNRLFGTRITTISQYGVCVTLLMSGTWDFDVKVFCVLEFFVLYC